MDTKRLYSNRPAISIGMPVRNGEKYVSQAIDSLLAQTFTDFELIICDNASTDRTERICREYAAKDGRIRYHRNERDIGPAQNYTRCFGLARGTYFRWHAHDDVCEPTYLARCLAVLQRDPSVINCHSLTRVIDERGQTLRDYTYRVAT